MTGAVGAATHDFMDLSADPERPNVLYGSGHSDLRTEPVDPLGLVVSEDGGRTWGARALVGRSDFHAMEATNDGADRGWDARRAELTRSVDRDANWTEGGVGEALVDLVIVITTDPNDPDRAFVAATDGSVLHSVDAGATWTTILENADPR